MCIRDSPGGIDAIVRKALAKDPKERFQTCEEMRNALLEQAALLNITPAVCVPASTAVAKSAPRPPAAFPHYLLEDAAPQPLTRIWPSMVAGLLVALIGSSIWAFYTRSQTGSFPPLVKKLVGALHRTSPPPQPSNSIELEESAGQQRSASVSDQTSQNSTVNDRTPAGTSSGTPASVAPNNAEGQHAQTAPESSGASSAPSQEPAAGQSSSSQPATDSAHASATATSVPSAGQTQTPQSSSASGDPVVAPSPAAVQQGDKNQAAAEGASAPNAPAANGDSAKAPFTSGTDESQTAAAASTRKPLKKPRPEPALTVDGFGRGDVPELLRQADAAARRGDYRLARYEYNLILKLDRTNTAAREGLHRGVQAAEQSY